MGIPHADQIMNVVVLTAVASCLNSGLYTASRMIFSLSVRGDAPTALRRLTPRGVPRNAVLASMVLGFVGIIGNYVLPEDLFGYLLATTGAVALFVYLVIAVSQLVSRRKLDAEGARPAVRMWLYPWLTWLAIAFIVFVMVMMLVLPDQRIQLLLSLALAVVVLIAGIVVDRRHGGAAGTDTGERMAAGH